MYNTKCPNCGNDINGNPESCKFCGFNLKAIDQLIKRKVYCPVCRKPIESNCQSCIYCAKLINDEFGLSEVKIESLPTDISLDNSGLKKEPNDAYQKLSDIDDPIDTLFFKQSKREYDLSMYDEALKSINKAINIKELNEYVIFKKEIESKLVKNDVTTEKSISEKEEDVPFNIRRAYNIAFDYFNKGYYLFSYEKLKDYDDINSLRLKCKCLYRLGEYDEALVIADKLFKKTNDPVYHDFKGKIYLSMHDKENSIKFFKLACKKLDSSLTNLAFAYGVFDEIDLSKECYLKVNDELSNLWLNYYNGTKELIISGLQNDFFNFPHLCCLKVDLYLTRVFEYLKLKDNRRVEKYFDLSETYLDKLIEFIKKYKLNNKFVSSNFIYLGKILDKFFVNNKFKLYNNQVTERFIKILKLIIKYYEMEWVNFSDKEDILKYCQRFAKLYISLGNKKAALKSYQLASKYINNDGELWLYIANLSKENKIVFYNKALFCFEKKLSIKYDDTSKKLKAVPLFYLNRKNEAIDLVKSMLPSRYNKMDIENYIYELNQKYAG